MVVDLVGILQDGTPLQPGVPADPRKTVQVVLGTDFTIKVRVITPGGVRVPLTGMGTAVTLYVKKRPIDNPAFKATATVLGNIATFTGLAHATKNIQPGYYVYDVWLTLNGKRDAVIPLAPWNFLATATPIP